jgi:hypothetical protein
MDLDAIKAHSKAWFGDHANWSHEQLLKLMVCKLRSIHT